MECCLQRRRVPEQSTPSARAWCALPRPIAGSRCLACPTSRTSCVAACRRRCSYVMVLLVAQRGGLVHRRAVKEGEPERARDRQPSLSLAVLVLSRRPTRLHTTLHPRAPKHPGTLLSCIIVFDLYSTRATFPNLRQKCPALRAITERDPRRRLQTATSHHTQPCRVIAETRPLLLPPSTMALAMTTVKRWVRCTTIWRK